ncbi:transmembrane protein, putative (macronuclear) [Tetrahymena thermophila SB210]|uniref:Transmembrane protein, putative n=1 Tax=Tetrahymena thermophila (strain SB210) TaxID=312017 RepID=I7MEZ2_TETTS|nr:transmembrane protein, putative [Tetrahymena thermophila SB210]EAR98175.2 transmembrane protein, putative [Tetrahymena thermophila SB210]|eukprot:XP_001018420.2 transmembrane protein, putative [Tetrahymena thermophila SB210]
MNNNQFFSQIQLEEKNIISNNQFDQINSPKNDNIQAQQNQTHNASIQLDFSIGFVSPSNKLLRQLDANNVNQEILQRNVEKKEQDEKNDNKKKDQSKSHILQNNKSPRSQMINSQKPISSRNSIDSQNLNNDQKFIQMLLKRDEKIQDKWYYCLFVFLRFMLVQLLNPILIIYIFLSKQRSKLNINRTKQSFYLLFILKFYFIVSSIFLWMALVNYIYIKCSLNMNNSDYKILDSEYNKVLMYYTVAGIGFSILNTTLFKNSSFFFRIYKSLQSQTSTNIPKCMKDLFISESEFVFQFFIHPQEDEAKIKERDRVKKVFNTDKSSPFFQITRYQQFYSGLDFCQKIVRYSEKLNVENKQQSLRQFIISLIAYLKAFIPGIYRQITEGHFEIYNTYFTVIPYLCIGNIVGYFARSVNSLQDLNFIYDYNRALCALISYEPYLKLKSKYKINTPCINPVDARSIKTWSQMRRLMNELKKKETIPIDQCTLFLFAYLIIVFLSVFLDKFYHLAFFFSISSDKYLVLYYTVDVILIFVLFCSRVYKQTQINELYKEQYKLLQNMKNILMKFFTFREYFCERDDITLLDKDIQWQFYKEMNMNYLQTLQVRKVFNKNKDTQNNKNVDIADQFDSSPISQQDQQYDFEYQQKFFNLIEFIQDEISMDILQTPMKFMGLVPSSYGLLSAFFSIAAIILYLAFYLFFYK